MLCCVPVSGCTVVADAVVDAMDVVVADADVVASRRVHCGPNFRYVRPLLDDYIIIFYVLLLHDQDHACHMPIHGPGLG